MGEARFDLWAFLGWCLWMWGALCLLAGVFFAPPEGADVDDDERRPADDDVDGYGRGGGRYSPRSRLPRVAGPEGGDRALRRGSDGQP